MVSLRHLKVGSVNFDVLLRADIVVEYNPAAEAFRNFESESQSGMMSSLHLDHDDDRRRGASRANSVRFDESANHHGASSRQSMEMLPVRTGSGMGMSERSYSHRSDGRGSTSGLSMRANSFGLEPSRLLGSTTNSPRAAANPPPGFLFLGPVPSIIRCWLSEDFSNDSVLYAAVCTGSYNSSISRNIVRRLGFEANIAEDSGSPKIKLSVYLTEATIQHSSSSRSSSPAPQVPTLSTRFSVYDAAENDRSIQVLLGSDVLRSHNADILLSEDRLLIFDDERNRLAVPLVRPESESTYRSLATMSATQQSSQHEVEKTPSRTTANGQYTPSVIRPPRFDLQASTAESSAPSSPAILPNADAIEAESAEAQPRKSEDNQAAGGSGSEKSFTASKPQTPSASSASGSGGVWGSTWRSGGPVTSSGTTDPSATKSASGYARAGSGRSMKVLRPSVGKSMASSTRAFSATGPSSSSTSSWGTGGAGEKVVETPRQDSQSSLADTTNKPASTATATKPTAAAAGAAVDQSSTLPTKANPIGQASAFGWLNSSGR